MTTTSLQDIAQTFRPPAFPGSYFLSLEGIEGAGKSTQLLKLQEYLESQGLRVLVLREPGGTPFGEKLRQAILSSSVDVHPLAEAYLFTASRAQLLHEVVLRELAVPGTVVIMDRYLDSTIAYQGVARKLGVHTVLEMHQHFPLHLVPHMTLYLKISVETSMLRQQYRNMPKDYYESKGNDFYRQLIEGYEQSMSLFPERVQAIPADGNENQVFESIKLALRPLLQTGHPL